MLNEPEFNSQDDLPKRQTKAKSKNRQKIGETQLIEEAILC